MCSTSNTLCILFVYAYSRKTLVPWCPSLGLFNNWNIILFSNKNTTVEDFKEINQVVLDIISDNMKYLVQYGKYGAMNATNPTKMR